MYLDNGREIYESDAYPGYFIDANTGGYCDEYGNYMGGNVDNGDIPGRYTPQRRVFITKHGKYYYAKPTKLATTSLLLSEAVRKGYKPSKGYKGNENNNRHKGS